MLRRLAKTEHSVVADNTDMTQTHAAWQRCPSLEGLRGRRLCPRKERNNVTGCRNCMEQIPAGGAGCFWIESE
jgi:hypothetical protein